MAHTRRDVHPTFGYVAVNLVDLGRRLGSPPMRPPEILRAFEHLGVRYHEYDLVRVARQCCGMHYRREALRSARPRTFDCSTLMQFIYAHAGLQLPRFSHLMVDCGEPVAPPYKPGDLLFTTGKNPWRHERYPNGIGHVAIATSAHLCVHTDNLKTKQVTEVPVADLHWPIAEAKRLLDDVRQCSVVQLPSHHLGHYTSDELEALVRKYLQVSHRPRSH